MKYVVVTEENIEEVAAWCNGEVGGEDKERFVKVTDKNAISTRQAKAFVDDYILKMSDTGTSFKAFTEKAFKKSYEPIVGSGEKLRNRVGPGASDREVARSARTGKFVSHDEAEANPDTTVVESIPGNAFNPSPTPKPDEVVLKGADFDGETEVLLVDANAEAKDPEDLEGPEHGQPYWEVHNDETVYFNAQGDVITKAEFDAWGE